MIAVDSRVLSTSAFVAAFPSRRWRTAAAVMFAACLAACGGAGHDGGAIDPARASCTELRAAYAAELAHLDRSCSVSSDCRILGAIPPEHICSSGTPALGESTGGDAVNGAALDGYSNAAYLNALIAAFDARCRDASLCGTGVLPCTADPAPSLASCQAKQCVPVIQYCNAAPPDAGVDASTPDASTVDPHG